MNEKAQKNEIRRIESYLLKLTKSEKDALMRKAKELNITIASLIRTYLINGITPGDL
jgi:hypothetical protein